MHNLIVFLLGTGTGITLKIIYDSYKNIKTNKDDISKNNVSKPKDNFTRVKSNQNIDKFYLNSISTLFLKYDVNINDLDAFGKLCNKIERQVKITFVESLLKQKTIQGLIESFHKKSIETIDITTTDSNSGPFITENYISDAITNLNLSTENIHGLIPKIKLILTSSYAKGIEMVLKNFGDKIYQIEDSFNKNDKFSEQYFSKLQNDLAFHLKLLKK